MVQIISLIRTPFRILLFFIFFTLISLLTIIVTSTLMSDATVRVIPVDYSVADVTGFNLDPDGVLHFGTLPPGSVSRRVVDLYVEEPMMVDVYVRDIPNLQVSANNFLLPAQEHYALTFSLSVPLDAVYESYTGKVSLYFNPVS